VFTGIVQELASVVGIDALQTGRRLTVATTIPDGEIQIGESIALNGACMTVVGTEAERFAVEVSKESLDRTTLGELAKGDRINLERSARFQDRIGGHFVSGHVDGVGTVARIEPQGDSWIYRFAIDPEIARLTVEKGSIAVDGVSLTCFHCTATTFDVAIISHTAKVTTLGLRRAGDRVNLENDVLGKYVAKLVDATLAERLRGTSSS